MVDESGFWSIYFLFWYNISGELFLDGKSSPLMCYMFCVYLERQIVGLVLCTKVGCCCFRCIYLRSSLVGCCGGCCRCNASLNLPRADIVVPTALIFTGVYVERYCHLLACLNVKLCYFIGSGYYGTKGIVTVSAGIDFDKEEVTRQEVLRQLKACQDGDITEEELTAAREAILSSLRATHDSPGAIEGYYATAALSGMKMTPAEYMAAIEAVTKEQVVAAANSLTLHTTYFLKGGSQ